jgi:hypothetical protein
MSFTLQRMQPFGHNSHAGGGNVKMCRRKTLDKNNFFTKINISRNLKEKKKLF